MDKVSKSSIEQAYNLIKDYIYYTPLKRSEKFSNLLRFNLFLKLENLNLSGSFKIRGACNCLLTNKQLASKGVVAASAGNHAQGVSRMARKLGIESTIFMPKYTPQIKIRSTEEYANKIVLEGDQYDASFAAAVEFAKNNNKLLIHGFSDPDVIIGQGTIGVELMQQVDQIDAIIVPIGGGGLISGIATYIKQTNPKIKIIGVQTAYYPAMKEKFSALILNDKISITPTIAEGIAVKYPGDINFEITKKYVDEIVIVDDDEISSAILDLMEFEHIIAEGAGAAAIAAITNNRSQLLSKMPSTANVVSIISGGNIDINLLSKITGRVLAKSGRLLRIKVPIEDRPGNLSKIINLIASKNINIVEISHNRVFTSTHAYRVECSFDLETTNTVHQNELIEFLKSNGYQIEKIY